MAQTGNVESEGFTIESAERGISPLMNWYYVEAGQQAGPVDDAQLQELLGSGKIQQETLVWREGMAQLAALPRGCGGRHTVPAPGVNTRHQRGGSGAHGKRGGLCRVRADFQHTRDDSLR